MDEIRIEVAFALADRQELLSLSVPRGTTLREAVKCSAIADFFPGLDLSSSVFGIFGHVVNEPDTCVLEEGARVEIYRPLIADPKEVRKQRAAKAALAKAGRPNQSLPEK